MSSLEFIGVEASGLGLTWGFRATIGDRETRVYAQTTLDGLCTDLQTDDGFYGGTGDAAVDRLVIDRVQRMIVWHDALRVLDGARGRDRRSGARRAA